MVETFLEKRLGRQVGGIRTPVGQLLSAFGTALSQPSMRQRSMR